MEILAGSVDVGRGDVGALHPVEVAESVEVDLAGVLRRRVRRIRVWDIVLADRKFRGLTVDGATGDESAHVLLTWGLPGPGRDRFSYACQQELVGAVGGGYAAQTPVAGTLPFIGTLMAWGSEYREMFVGCEAGFLEGRPTLRLAGTHKWDA